MIYIQNWLTTVFWEIPEYESLKEVLTKVTCAVFQDSSHTTIGREHQQFLHVYSSHNSMLSIDIDSSSTQLFLDDVSTNQLIRISSSTYLVTVSMTLTNDL